MMLSYLKSKKNFSLSSSGNSMFPLLRSNDIIFYKRTKFNQIKIDDLILVSKNRKYSTSPYEAFTHRVIYKTEKNFITRGNNNLRSDGKIYPHQIVGKVIEVKRNGFFFDPENLYLVQSTWYFQEIINIKKKFDRLKINYVFLKGLPLHLYFEKTHPRRIYLDCDVLIEKKCFKDTEKVLLENGYKKYDSSLSNIQKKLKDKEVENAYFKVANGFSVVFDLHLEVVFMMTQLGRLEALYQQNLIDQLTDELLKTKRTVKINGLPFFILNTKYLILYLALHLFHHNFHGAFRLNFMNTIIKKSKLSNKNWLEMIQITNQYQLRNFVYPAFKLLQKYYKTPIPKEFFHSIQPSNYQSSRIYHLGSIFDDEPRIGAGINRFKNIFCLSPNPWWKKIFVFTNPSVIYFIFWSLKKKLFSFFSNQRVIHSNPKAKV